MSKFWETKSLKEMTQEEWELLCDGCGLCCLIKLEDDETGEVFDTNVTCHLLDIETCRCKQYARRHEEVEICITLSIEKIEEFKWLPKTCAYRLVAEGKPLAEWHPLTSNDPTTVHTANISVKRFAVSEEHIHPDQLFERIIEK